jgi:hypothetical protein
MFEFKPRIITAQQLREGYRVRRPDGRMEFEQWEVLRERGDGTYEARPKMPEIIEVKLKFETPLCTLVMWADGFYMVFPGDGVYFMFEDEHFDSEGFANMQRTRFEEAEAERAQYENEKTGRVGRGGSA